MRIRTLVAATLVWLAAVTVGCGQKKVEECNSLIQVINRGVKSLERGAKAASDPEGPEELRAMAETMDAVAADAQKLTLTQPELQKFSTDYQDMAKAVATAARAMVAAVEAKEPKKFTEAQEQLEAAVKREDPLIEGLNVFCQTP